MESTRNLKLIIAVALGVIVMLLLFLFRGHNDVPHDQTKLDSLQKVHVTSMIEIAHLQKRDIQWGDSLKDERARNKITVTRIIHPAAVIQLSQGEVNAALTARYKKPTHIEPSDVGSQVVADLDIMDKALDYIPRVEREIEHWQKAFVTKDSLNQALISDRGNLTEQTKTLKLDNEALNKQNTKLAKGNRFWKGLSKVMAGALVAVGFIAYTK